jgi:hypothetical protein
VQQVFLERRELGLETLVDRAPGQQVVALDVLEHFQDAIRGRGLAFPVFGIKGQDVEVRGPLRPSSLRKAGATAYTLLSCSCRFSRLGWYLYLRRTSAAGRSSQLVTSGYIPSLRAS